MSKRRGVVVLTLLVAMLLFPVAALAHETITLGEYDIEYGWLNEPAIAGQPNAVVININKTGAEPAEVDISALKIQTIFGAQNKILTLQPLGEDTPGRYIAPVTPTRPGQYIVHLSGNIGSTTFDHDIKPEEVQTAELVQFPTVVVVPVTQATDWIAIAGVVLGALGTLLGLGALLRKPARG